MERQYSYDEVGQHAEDNSSEKMIIHGDNLKALKALLPQKVKCIYIEIIILCLTQGIGKIKKCDLAV